MNSLEATRKYREEFRKNEIPRWYSGPLHMLINGGVLTGLILFCLSQVTDLKMRELLIVPMVVVLGNFVVWWLHRYPLHRRYKIFPYAYNVHTKSHHRFYTDELLVYEGTQDWWILFFPPETVVGFAAIYAPATFYLLSWLWSANAGFLFVTCSAGYFLMYEVVHYTNHLPEDHWFLKIPFFKYMWTHHKIHHAPELMGDYNFNIAFPLFDFVFGTHYKGPWPLQTARRSFEEVCPEEK